MGLRISDLKAGDRVAVTWYRGMPPVVGTVKYVVRNASRASGTIMQTDSGNRMRINANMRIERAS
jgi:hypothetical protein